LKLIDTAEVMREDVFEGEGSLVKGALLNPTKLKEEVQSEPTTEEYVDEEDDAGPEDCPCGHCGEDALQISSRVNDVEEI
jgi:hypothetical protein